MQLLTALRRETERGIRNTRIARAALDGSLTQDDYARYLLNVWHYALHSSKVIGLAGSRAVNSHPELAQYLFHHAQEELGHDAWVLEDLNNLGWSNERVMQTRATPRCAAMIGYEYYLAGTANPVSLFGWLYILEAMGDDLGKEVAMTIARNPKFGNSVKFIRGHGVADEAHTEDLTRMIGTHITGRDMDDVVHVAEVVQMLYVGMLHECLPQVP
jgi:pyrroloquinoline quinone (PQQ) biosynthesis protein C